MGNNSSRNIRAYGWTRDKPDERDLESLFAFHKSHVNISSVDMREKSPPVYDQGNLGSCTANGIGFCYQYDEMKQDNYNNFVPSRLFIYYNEREKEGTVKTDSGASVRDGIKCINILGVCDETLWPYDIAKFTVKPSQICYDEGKKAHAVKYHRVKHTLEQLKLALVHGYPVVFGFDVYESFESEEVAKTGIMPYPKPTEKMLGGHCVALVGYDDSKEMFIVRNSWGSEWGDKGYFYMPYSYATSKHASDFWTVTSVTDPHFPETQVCESDDISGGVRSISTQT